MPHPGRAELGFFLASVPALASFSLASASVYLPELASVFLLELAAVLLLGLVLVLLLGPASVFLPVLSLDP